MVSRLKVERVKAGLTQAMLAKKAGRPQAQISMVENGLLPDGPLAQKIAEILGCEIKDIFPVFFPNEEVLQVLYGDSYQWPWEEEK